jgi:hypothetical protein
MVASTFLYEAEVKVARKQKFPKLTAQQAHAALRWFHALGKVTAKDIENALGHRDRLVAEIKTRLEQLGGEGLRFLRDPEALNRAPAKRKRRRPSPKAQAAWRAQGRYMAAVRRLSKANRAKVKAIREKAGVGAAVKAAKRLAAD